MTYLHYFILLAVLLEQSVAHDQLIMPVVNIPRYGACPEVEEHKDILQQVRSNISKNLRQSLGIVERPECGDGEWYRVAYLNMTDLSRQCPGAWREYNTSGVRACGRPVSDGESYPATVYTIDRQYSMVCGRVIGYQVGSPDGFLQLHYVYSLNQGYMDGISITYGDPRHHIWSYVAGCYENHSDLTLSNCPCTSAPGVGVRTFLVGSNYYCESGNPSETWNPNVYQSDPLWDGQQCEFEGTCCSGTKSPPWFSVQLPTHTTDRIEVRICADEPTENEDVLIELLEIYVQ